MIDTPRRPKVLFLAEDFWFSALPLVTMHRADVDFLAVWGSDPRPAARPLARNQHESLLAADTIQSRDDAKNDVTLGSTYLPNLATLCKELEITYKALSPLFSRPAAVAAKSLEPDVIITVNLEQPVPQALRECARLGFLNLHFAAQPIGNSPTFWEMRSGKQESGVCVHGVGDNIWDGPLYATQPLSLANCVRFQDYEIEKVKAAASLLASTLNTFPETKDIQGSKTNYLPAPSDEGWFISPDMSCNKVEVFTRAFGNQSKVKLRQGDSELVVDGIVSSDRNQTHGTPGDIEPTGHDRLRFRATDGWVTLLVSRLSTKD